MKFLLFLVSLLARKIKIKGYETFTIKDNVTKGQLYKYVINAHEEANITTKLIDPMGREIVSSDDVDCVLHTKIAADGQVKIEVTNWSGKATYIWYRCPDVNKELYGALGPIKDVDLVAELQRVLETVIHSQRNHIKKHELHIKMVEGSRKWVSRVVLLEVIFSCGIIYFLHRRTLNMFEKKRNA